VMTWDDLWVLSTCPWIDRARRRKLFSLYGYKPMSSERTKMSVDLPEWPQEARYLVFQGMTTTLQSIAFRPL
jgi:hypothetical protein